MTASEQPTIPVEPMTRSEVAMEMNRAAWSMFGTIGFEGYLAWILAEETRRARRAS